MEMLSDKTAASNFSIAERDCSICGSHRAGFLFVKHAYPVFRCRTCGAEFVHPQPEDDVLADIYGTRYFLRGEGPEEAERIARMKGATAALYLDRIAGRMEKGALRILEIGCGMGDLLVQARLRGFQVRGVEVSPSSAAEANRRLGGDFVHTGTLETSDLPRGFFDVVVGCDVVEHVRNPHLFLESVHTFLKPGGMVFFVTPSTDSWSRLILGRHWMEYKTEHLFYFGRASIRYLLQKNGFESIALWSNRKVLSIDYVNRHFQRFHVEGLSWLLDLVSRVVPKRLLFHHFTMPASGVLVMARKPRVTSEVS